MLLYTTRIGEYTFSIVIKQLDSHSDVVENETEEAHTDSEERDHHVGDSHDLRLSCSRVNIPLIHIVREKGGYGDELGRCG